MQSEANTAVEDLVTGNETDITKVMSAVEKADVAFQTLMAVRGKLVEEDCIIMLKDTLRYEKESREEEQKW